MRNPDEIRPAGGPVFGRLPAAGWVTSLIILLYACHSGEKPEIRGKGEFETTLDYRIFADPPSKFRAYPFYSINDKLDPEEISRQVHGFKKAGFGGFYLHSREGLLTEYLGNDWWKAMDAAVDAAGQTGLNACFYDEDKWPSGFSGGTIPLMKEEYRARCLARIRKNTPLPEGAQILAEKDSMLYISCTASLGNPIFNGTCYVDLFNPEMVRTFINEAYKPYIERYKVRFAGKPMEIFTDEPHIHARYFDRNTPHLGVRSWSPSVEKKFMEMWGYNLSDYFNLLFEEKDNWREVRLHYHQAVAKQFEESFTRQIGQLCGENGVKFTGHFLGEESLDKIRDRIGNAMLHYRHMQQPGIDNLGMTIDGRLITVKSVSSVANQYDIPDRLCEIYGISGQNMSFEDRKWLSGWQTVLGVNHMVPHLALYSLKGARKRDYPPTISQHQPWWPYNKLLEDYVARISYAATIGRYAPQFLVIHPLESEYIRSDDEEEFTGSFLSLLQKLQESHYGYDLGDEQILADIARVKGSSLEVGAMNYQALFLPDMIGIRQTTFDLIEKFIEEGGLVFSTGRFPLYINGKMAESKLESLEEKVIKVDMNQFSRTLSWKIKPSVVISGKNSTNVWSSVRQVNEGTLVMLTNISHTEPADILLETGLLRDNPVVWDPSEVKCTIPYNQVKELFDLHLDPSETIWLTSGSLSEHVMADSLLNNHHPLPAVEKIVTPKWEGKRHDPNAWTLDFARYSIDQGKSFSEPEPVIGIFQRLSSDKYRGSLILRYSFASQILPEKIDLVVEQPEMYKRIEVNAQPVQFVKERFYLDPQFLSADIRKEVVKGENTIHLELDFRPAIPESTSQQERYGTEIESIYLTGDFGVSGQEGVKLTDSQYNKSKDRFPKPVYSFSGFTLSAEKTTFSGDLTTEGYPFYAGAFELTTRFDLEKREGLEYFLSFPSLDAIVAVIELNGRTVDTLVWSPWKTGITADLKDGTNALKITLVSSLRNLLGPHHHPAGELIRVGPDSFTGSGGFPEPSGDKNWYDLRKVNPVLKLWNDHYHLIPFGLPEAPVIRGYQAWHGYNDPFLISSKRIN